MAKKMTIGAAIALDGEREYRQAISGITSDQKVLTSEMKLAQAAFANNANSVDALSSKGDILNRQLDKQKEKVEALKHALENSKNQYGENDTKTDAWKTSLNNAEAELSKLDKELKTNNKYLDEAKASSKGTADSIDKFGKEVKTAGDHTSRFGDIVKANLTSAAIIGGVQALGSAIGNAATKSVDLVQDTAAYADNMLALSTQTGVSTDKLQAYNYMAELTDTSMETLTGSMAKNIKSMTNAQNGSEKFTAAYERLKVKIDDGNGKLRDSEEVYWDVIDALKGITDETERDSISMQLFGKKAQELNNVIDIGTEGVGKFTDEAVKMGAVLDEDTLNSLGETDDALQRMNQSVDIAKRKFGAEMAPAMTEAAEKITAKLTDMDGELADMAGGALNAVVDGFSWMADNSDLVISGLTGIGAAMITSATAGVVTQVVTGIKAFTIATEGATVAQTAFNTAQKANLIGMAATAVVGLGVAAAAYTKAQDGANEELREMEDCIDDVVEKSNHLISSVEDSKAAFEDSTDQIETNYKANKILSDNLYELADKENKTNAEKAQMQTLINQLNDSIPNLNLAIDEQTGKLNLQQIQVDKLTQSYKDKALTQAYEERYVELTKEQIDLQEQYKAAADEAMVAEKALTGAKEEANAVNDYEQLEVAMSSEITKQYQEQLDNATKTVKELSEKLGINAGSLKDVENFLGNATTATEEFTNTATTANSDLQAELVKSQEAYDKAKESAIDSIQGQIDIFDKFYDKNKISGEELLKNLESQVTGISEWADNLEELSKRGIDDGLLKHLKEMGPSAAKEIAALTDLSDEELKKYSGKWVELGEATEKAAEISVSDTKEVYDKAYKREQSSALAAGEAQMASHNQGVKKQQGNANKAVLGVVEGSIEYGSKNSATEAQTSGKNVIDGIIKGIMNGEGTLLEKIASVGKALNSTFNQSIDAHSPSRVFEKSGGYIADGVIKGVDGKKENLKKSAAELGELYISAAKTKLDNLKVYNDLSIKQEIDYWDTIRKECKKGTQARIDADKEYLSLKKELEVEHKELLDKRVQTEKDYRDKCKKINSDLIKDVESVNKSYQDSVDSRASSIASSLGLFKAVDPAKAVSGRDLVNNLAGQVSALSSWGEDLDNLKNRGISEGLIEELRKLGVSSASEVQALTELTDDELKQYVSLWEAKSKMAREQAVEELSGLKEDASEKIKELNEQANRDLRSYYKSYTEAMKELGVAIKEPMIQLKATIGADGKIVVQSAVQAMINEISSSLTKSTLKQSWQDLINETIANVEMPVSIKAGLATSGFALMGGIASGMSSNTSILTGAATNAMQAVINGARAAAGIHSPSTKMAELVGKPLAQGVGVGFVDNMAGVQKEMANAIPMDFNTDVNMNSVNNSSGTIAAQLNTLSGMINDLKNMKITSVSETPIIVDLAEVGRVVTKSLVECDMLNNATPRF